MPSSEDTPTPSVRVPKLTRDPLWSLRMWPVTVTVRAIDYTIPAMSAADWLPFLMGKPPQPDLIVPVLLPAVDEVYSTDDSMDIEDMYWLSYDIVSEVTGRPWWITMRLCGCAQHNWEFISAQMLFHGIHADQVSIAAWLDAVLLIILENIKPENAEMFNLQLESPPPDVEDEGAEEPEMSAAQFLSMA